MKSISWDFCEHQGEIMHKRDQCRPCWPGVSDIGHRAGTGFPENSTKWEEDLPHLTTHCAFSPWISSVQSLSCVRVFATLWTAARQTSLSIYIYILAWRILWTEKLADYSPWGHKQWDMTEQVTLHVKGTLKGESGNRNISALNGKVLFSSSYHSRLHKQWKTSGHAKPRQC